MVGLYLGYCQFQELLPGGGPLWRHLWGFQNIARDYVDILLCLGAAFSLMVVFEKSLRSSRWLGGAAVAVVALALPRLSTGLWPLLDNDVTLAEGLLAGLIVGLWALLAIDLAVRVRRGLATPVADRREVSWKAAIRSGFFRWFALWSLFAAAIGMYLGSRVYAGIPAGTESYYLNWRVTSVALFLGFTLLGLPYCIVTVKRRACLHEDRSDPGLSLILLARRVWRQGPTAFRLLGKRRFRVVFLDLCVKYFWAPLMVTFIFGECGNFHEGWRGAATVFAKLGAMGGLAELGRSFVTTSNEAFVQSSYQFLYHGLFVIDCSIGLLGYLTSSRWLGTKSKSVEFTALGWWVALMCYPPFNSVTGTYLPYDYHFGSPYYVFTLLGIHRFMMVATLLLFTIYVWATIVFGLRFSNLTHRGLIDKGPFRYIRHPAYATKNIAWWTESVLQFSNPWQFFYLACLNIIYILRALTEERHLMHFEDYRRYAARVRWRFIPGVI